MNKRSRITDAGYYDDDDNIAFVFVPAKGFETTHEVLCVPNRNRPVVRSKLTGRNLKISKAGRVLMCPARKWEYVDTLVPSSSVATKALDDSSADEDVDNSESDNDASCRAPSWGARLLQCMLWAMLTYGVVMVLAAPPPDEKARNNSFADFANSAISVASSFTSRMVSRIVAPSSSHFVADVEGNGGTAGDTWM
jgi:hypothetical protein